MEQEKRNIERARALRISALSEAAPVPSAKKLSAYFAGRSVEQRTKAKRRAFEKAA